MTTSQPKPAANRASLSGGRSTPRAAKPGAGAQASYERYLAMAKAKALAGDRIEAERYYQYAEHYHRLISGSAA